MLGWAARRLGISVLLVWIVASLVFLAIRLVPGDPAELLLSQGGASPDPAAVQELREQLGLDRPVLVQYVADMGQALRGNLGQSIRDGSPVMATSTSSRSVSATAAAGAEPSAGALHTSRARSYGSPRTQVTVAPSRENTGWAL